MLKMKFEGNTECHDDEFCCQCFLLWWCDQRMFSHRTWKQSQDCDQSAWLRVDNEKSCTSRETRLSSLSCHRRVRRKDCLPVSPKSLNGWSREEGDIESEKMIFTRRETALSYYCRSLDVESRERLRFKDSCWIRDCKMTTTESVGKWGEKKQRRIFKFDRWFKWQTGETFGQKDEKKNRQEIRRLACCSLWEVSFKSLNWSCLNSRRTATDESLSDSQFDSHAAVSCRCCCSLPLFRVLSDLESSCSCHCRSAKTSTFLFQRQVFFRTWTFQLPGQLAISYLRIS